MVTKNQSLPSPTPSSDADHPREGLQRVGPARVHQARLPERLHGRPEPGARQGAARYPVRVRRKRIPRRRDVVRSAYGGIHIRRPHYNIFHPLVVEVSCVLFWTKPARMVQKQNTQNFYHKRMKDSVGGDNPIYDI